MSAVGFPETSIGGRRLAPSPEVQLWESVGRLVERASRYSDLEVHGLQHLAPARVRRLGYGVPERVLAAQRWAAVCSILAPLVLGRILETVDEPVVLMKGPELALRYPDPAWRPYRDLDVLVSDAQGVWQTLRDAGFEETGDPELYVDNLHHLRPLVLPELPLIVEVHSRPKWIDGMAQPDTAELVETAVPSRLAVDGLLTLDPARHAVTLAAHAWAHAPLNRIVHLVDIAVMSATVDRSELEEVADGWGVGRVWRATSRAVDGLLFGRTRPVSGRIWARHLWRVRERTVLERHLQHWLSPYWGLSLGRALGVTMTELRRELRPAPGETWRQKLRQMLRALRDAFIRLSDHDRSLQTTTPSEEEERT